MATSPLNAHVVAWVASTVVREMSITEVTKCHHTRTSIQVTKASQLSSVGLKVLKISELKGVWKHLKHMQFVCKNTRGYQTNLPGQAKKGQWVAFIGQYLELPGALQLEPFVNNDDPVVPLAIPAAAAAAMPPLGDNFDANLERYQMSDNTYAGNAFHSTMQADQPLYQHHQHHQHHQQHQQHQQQQLQENERMRQARHHSAPQYPAHAAAAAPAHMANAAAGGSAAAADAAFARHQHSSPGGRATSKSPKKRKATDLADMASFRAQRANLGRAMGDAGHQFNPWTGVEAATMAAALPAGVGAARGDDSSLSDSLDVPATAGISAPAATATTTDRPQSMVEMRLFAELSQMGFKDMKECLDAIRNEVAKSAQSPTSDMVMMAILAHRDEADGAINLQRDEAHLAKEMDEARLQSEQQKKIDSERLREERKMAKEERLLQATYADFLEPKKNEDQRLMFPKSWLLRHKPSRSLLTDIVNNRDHTEAKKSLIALLKSEKSSNQWYAEDFAKPYFTWVVGIRLLAVSAELLKQEIDLIVGETDRAIGLPSQQDKDGKPLLFIKAKEDYYATQAPGESSTAEDGGNGDDDGGGDDSDIEVMTEEEVRQLQQAKDDENNSQKPRAVVLG